VDGSIIGPQQLAVGQVSGIWFSSGNHGHEL